MADSAAATKDASADTSANVLLVTDDQRLRAELVDAFPAGYEVSVLPDARQAREYLETNRASVLVVDIRTGSAGGFGLLKAMQQDPRIADVPAVMIVERSQDKWLAKEAGAQLVLTKPVGAERVVANAISLVDA
ncbi:MAG: response regulator [Acidobacteriota bacterium]|nr:response regulator [Acidobacteriota bacterium]